jgi:N-methylhydantoinase B/oxoprolinase/acetone carboxylase alpha subunit
LKLYSVVKSVTEVLDILAANIRVLEETIGDLRAEIAATGERRYKELCEKYGGARLPSAIYLIIPNK